MDGFVSGGLAAMISLIGAVYSARAAKNSKPISNGFADGVRQSLARIESRLDDHLRDHSNK